MIWYRAWFVFKDILFTNYMEYQYCKNCNATKHIDCFNGKNKYCIRCLEKYRERHQLNKDKRREQWKRYYENHRDELYENKKEYLKSYNQIEVYCEMCECHIKKSGWTKHIQTNKHQTLEKQKKDEEDKLKQMDDEEKDEYFKIKQLKSIWNKVRL